MSDGFTFKCAECGHPVSIDESNPPANSDILKCYGCGREIGEYGKVKAALIQAAKDKVDEMVRARFGKRPKWG